MDQFNRVAWIGTGVMGASMASHLIERGYEVIIHTRTRSRAEPLLHQGALWADTPRDAANGADIAFSMVGYPRDVREVHLGGNGTLSANEPPRLIVDMTTSSPSLAVEIAGTARSRGVESLDAPVSGGDVGAREGTLSIMIGAHQGAFDRVQSVLAVLGSQVVRQGGPGAGQHTKMVNQILIASMMMGVCEGLVYASHAGLDSTTVLKSVGSGAAGSWSLSNLAPRMIDRDFEPGFYIEHFVKDLGIALGEADCMGLAFPGLSLARELYKAASAQGLDRKGTQALLLVLESLNGRVR